LRWNIDVAAREFSLSAPTLRKSLAKSDAIADEHGCFATRQILAAVFGAIDLEKLRTQEQVTKRLTLENAITEGSVVNRAELSKCLAAIADAMVSRITASGLSQPAQEDLLRELSGIPVMLQGVASRQTKLRLAHDGDNGDDDGDKGVRKRKRQLKKQSRTRVAVNDPQ
jgi:hypothetical protein